MKKTILIFILLIAAWFVHAQTIPDNWQGLYDTLEKKLLSIDSALTKNWNGQKYCTNYCSNLLPAGSNKGEELLTQLPGLYSVNKYLEALDPIGVTAIDLTIQYPILVNSFPRSGEYLDYYIKVSRLIKSSGKKLLIGCQSTFRDSVFGRLNVDSFYTGLNTQRYKTEKLQMMQTIIDSLQPDYLTIEMEPGTQEMNLGLDFSVDSCMSYIDFFMAGLDKKNSLIGAGTGTWDDMKYIDTIVKRPDIDYIDYHIYPVNKDFFVDKIFTIDSLAKQYSKKLIIGECWLHKASDYDLETKGYLELFSRDVFSFWTPLDSLFIESIVKLSHYSKIEVTSLFWSNLFFSYVNHTPAHDSVSPGLLFSEAFSAAGPNIISKTFTATGQLYHDLIIDACDTINSIVTPFDKNENFLINLYPNPSGGKIFLTANSPDCYNYVITVLSASGNILQQKKLQHHAEEFDLSGYSNGIYYLKLQTPEYSNSVKVVIIK